VVETIRLDVATGSFQALAAGAPGAPLVLVLHGPNLGALGRRDPGHYGALDLDQIMDRLAKLAGELGLAVEGLQSDAEGDLVEALLAAGAAPPVAMMALAAELDEAGEHRLAFEVQSRIPGEGQTAVSYLGWSHHYLRRWKGEDAALAWLRPRLAKLSPRDGALLAMVGYQSRDFDLLWEVDDVGPDRSNIEFHWLLRAAAAVRTGPSRDPQRARLERHYARQSAERYALLGRFLLGRESAAAALAGIVDPRSRCETYYYLGLAAQAQGAIREASRWYARCIETGQSYNGEYHWAYLQLHEWVAKEASLARLEAAARRAPFAALAP